MGTQLNCEAAEQFEQGIIMVLSRWTALQMALDQNSGGPHSQRIAEELCHSLFSLFNTSKDEVCNHDVVPILAVCMEDDLNTYFEDDGDDTEYKEIAEQLVTMHKECLEGNFNSIKRLKEAAPPRRPSYIRQVDSDDSDDNDDATDEILSNDDSSAMVVDAPETCSRESQMASINSPQTDDGWTVVRGSRRNRGRKN